MVQHVKRRERLKLNVSPGILRIFLPPTMAEFDQAVAQFQALAAQQQVKLYCAQASPLSRWLVRHTVTVTVTTHFCNRRRMLSAGRSSPPCPPPAAAGPRQGDDARGEEEEGPMPRRYLCKAGCADVCLLAGPAVQTGRLPPCLNCIAVWKLTFAFASLTPLFPWLPAVEYEALLREKMQLVLANTGIYPSRSIADVLVGP